MAAATLGSMDPVTIIFALRLRRRRGLHAVTRRGVRWRARPVLNRSERTVWIAATSAARRCHPGWRVWPQVSLGEVVATEGRARADRDAFAWVNRKRIDLLLVDQTGFPLTAIEYQGRGHYRSDWRARDAVKRAVLDAAGIPLVEVMAGMERTPAELEAALLAEMRTLRPTRNAAA